MSILSPDLKIPRLNPIKLYSQAYGGNPVLDWNKADYRPFKANMDMTRWLAFHKYAQIFTNKDCLAFQLWTEHDPLWTTYDISVNVQLIDMKEIPVSGTLFNPTITTLS